MNIIIACIVAAVIAFGISFGLGYVVIPFLHKIKFGQTILDIGPKWHKKKRKPHVNAPRRNAVRCEDGACPCPRAQSKKAL